MKLIRFLKNELSFEAKEWVQEGVISKGQAEVILERYGAKFPEKAQSSAGYYILLTLASLLIGIAIIVIMGENWEETPRMVRMGGMFFALLAIQSFGFHLFKQGKEGLATTVFFLGSLTYGAAIFLIAQIYHIEAHYPNGIFYWALGVLPFALILKSKALLFLTLSLSAIWAYLEFGMGYFPGLFLLFAASSFYFAFKIKHSILLYGITYVLSVVFLEFALSHWYFPFRYSPEWGIVHVFFTVSVLMASTLVPVVFEQTSFAHYIRDYALVTRLWAVRGGVFFLFIFSFSQSWKELIRSAPNHLGFIVLNGMFLLVVMGVSYWCLSKDRKQSLFKPKLSGCCHFRTLATQI